MNIRIGWLWLYFCCHLANAQDLKIDRVEPLNWWVGMYQPKVQLMVHGQQLGKAEVTIDYPGVVLEKVRRVENENYAFLDLRIGAEAKPGKIPIQFKPAKGKTLVYDYPLLVRNHQTVKAQGINTSDFIYLLMPDRFANGDPKNDMVKDMRETSLHRDSMYYRHGGDLQGVLDHLDYLQELGVTTLWFTPVLTNDMEQASYHGYANTENYHIDPRFGTNELYRELAKELHRRDMKLIQDVVPNHVGKNHWTVLDMPMKDWVHQWTDYTNTSYKDQTLYDPYAAKADKKIMTDGWFVPSMPDLNQNNPYVQNYIIQSHIWWIEYAGVDGFRIDTYPYNDLDFMAKWGEALTDEYPDFTYFGETWVHGVANQAYFTQGNTLHQGFDTRLQGVTDFQLNYAIAEALNGNFEWTGGINRLYTTLATDFVYEDATRNVVFLGNHDLSRFLSIVGEDVEKMKSATSWLLTTRGIPQWYYGDELLMKNFSDPDGKVREDVKGGWSGDKQNKFTASGRTDQEEDFFRHVKALATYRRENRILQDGKMLQYVPEDGIYVYFRIHDDKRVMVVMNGNDEEKTVELNRFSEGINGMNTAKNIVTSETVNSLKSLALRPRQTLVLELIK
ncbi:glycoside hydrolase family 13 protein [Olivibacter sitiensis]|uniref:glycoside hydrolase family 13 protein n=1 Tax=Olivibacter sitiensis TaxID=376470 RepID=UPI000409D0B0|nr:glycoside hydrolase family 13 protein [Olivibacter sitiensis]